MAKELEKVFSRKKTENNEQINKDTPIIHDKVDFIGDNSDKNTNNSGKNLKRKKSKKVFQDD